MHALDVALGDVDAAPLAVLEDRACSAWWTSISSASSVKDGAMMTSQNCFSSASANAGVDRAVDADDAAEGRHRVARERRAVGLEHRAADGDAARVVVLDDRARRQLELLRQQARGVEVEHVVERQLLAAELADHREHVHARAGLRVVGGALVRVLAVREVGDLLVGVQQQRREVVLLLDEPARDRAVVAGGVGERLGGERLARAERELAAGVLELLQHRVVAGRVDHDRREGEVLRRRADHRRAADVDVLDHLVLGRAAAARRWPRTDRGSRTRGRRTRPRARPPRPCAPRRRAARAGRRRASGAAS